MLPGMDSFTSGPRSNHPPYSTRPAGGAVRFVVVDDTAGQDDAVEELGSLDDVRGLAPPFNLLRGRW